LPQFFLVDQRKIVVLHDDHLASLPRRAFQCTMIAFTIKEKTAYGRRQYYAPKSGRVFGCSEKRIRVGFRAEKSDSTPEKIVIFRCPGFGRGRLRRADRARGGSPL
jgi:hypothetical protein